MSWKSFYFDTNACFGDVNSPEDWEQIKAGCLKFGIDPMATRLAESSLYEEGALPVYGYRRECRSEKKLSDFFAENGMLP